MILFVVLAFLGVLRHSAGSTVGVDCGMYDFDACDMASPCQIKLSDSFQSEFSDNELIRMTYHQDAAASEPSCSDPGCEQYTSNTAYYTVVSFGMQGEDHVVTSIRGREAICDERCSTDDSGTFSGYCQTAGQCLESTNECSSAVLMIGSATLEKNPTADIVIDCDIDDEENCGTVYKPCNAKFHTSSGFSQNDVVSMAYRQQPNGNEASCEDSDCKEYASEIVVYYTVVDTTTAAEGIVILGPKGFAPACPAACAVVDGGPFSGYCQTVDDLGRCAEFAGQCDGSTDPTGKAYFHLGPPPPPITGTVNATIGFACDMGDFEFCGALSYPCTLRSNWMLGYEFFKGELVAMTYHQDANASEPSCKDSGCEQFTSSSTTFFKVDDFGIDPEYHVLVSKYGRNAFCDERCSTEWYGSFSGYCQKTSGQCLYVTDSCEEDTVMPGLASFEKISIDVVVDCDIWDDFGCGTKDMPCNAILHESSGFTQNDLVSMVYLQMADLEARDICSNGCFEYQSSPIFYTVSDTTSGVEGQVIMGAFAFAPACEQACGVSDASVPPSEDDQVFSGFCQKIHECQIPMSPCDGFHNNNPPLGKAYFVLEEKEIPTPTTTRDPTEPTEPTGTGTATGTTEPTTAMTAALAVVAVLALWA